MGGVIATLIALRSRSSLDATLAPEAGADLPLSKPPTEPRCLSSSSRPRSRLQRYGKRGIQPPPSPWPGSQVPASGTANKEEVVVHLHAERPQLTSKAFTQNGFDEALCIKHVILSVGC